ncbi:SAM-dependent methyltransferase [Amycolatopsis sp. TRM77291]
MTAPPDPYFLTPKGTVPNEEAEADNPTVARVNGALLDRLLGTRSDGTFVADRELAAWIDADVPGYGWSVFAQRLFLKEVISHAAEVKGITQFVVLRAELPLGPDQATPHSMAKAHTASPTTILVARETIPCAQQKGALREQHRAATILAPVHDVHRPLHTMHDRDGWALDLGKPVCLTMVGDPSHWPGDGGDLIRAYDHELAEGSVLGVSALGAAPAGSAAAAALDDLARHLRATPEPELTLRTPAEIEGWFDGTGWDVEFPGVAPVSRWAGPPPADLAGPELPVWCAIATRASS